MKYDMGLEQGGEQESDLLRRLLVERYLLSALSFDMVAAVALDGYFLETTHAWKITGYTDEELAGQYLLEFMHFEDRERALGGMQRLITSDIEITTLDFRFLCKDGEYKRLLWNVAFSPEHESFFGVVRDLTERAPEEAFHDLLTGLPGRRLLHDRLSKALRGAARDSTLTAVLFVDLDGFKPINDTYGHKGGDILLRQVGLELRKCAGETDTVARLGGDEFILVLSGLAAKEDAEPYARRVLTSLTRSFDVLGIPVRIGASIGVAVYPFDGSDPDEIIQSADAAMYQAKKAGRGRFQFFSTPE